MAKHLIDIFNEDAFTLTTLTDRINNIDHVPGAAGTEVFAGIGEGVRTTSVAIESNGGALTLIQTTPRGSPAEQELQDKRELRPFNVPQIKLEDTIHAHSIMGIRAGKDSDPYDDLMRGAEYVVDKQLRKMVQRHDLTLEFHRLGALKGEILDADGSTLLNLFASFDILNGNGQPAPETFNFELDNPNTDIRAICQNVHRYMRRAAKMPIPPKAKVHCFAGDNWFDAFISHRRVKDAVRNTNDAPAAMGHSFAFGIYEFADIYVENYMGTDDDSYTVGIHPDEAIFFFNKDVPGLYAEYFAPADFLDAVNRPGLPRYARIAHDQKFGQKVEIHTQQNPLPLCLRPQTLVRGVASL